MIGSIRDRLEAWFGELGLWVFDHRWMTLIGVILLCAPFLAQLGSITIDNRTERMFLEGDAALIDYREFRDQFGTDDYIVVALDPPEAFSLAFFSQLRNLHTELEHKVPHVAEVTSLVNARRTYGEGDTLIVEDLMERWPETQTDLEDLRRRVLSNTFYVNRLIADDGVFVTVMIRPRSVALPPESDVLDGFDLGTEQTEEGEDQLTSVEFSEMVTAVREVLETFEATDVPVYLAGGPVVTDAINRAVPRDLAKLMPTSLLIIVVFLLALFRRLSGVVYPVFIVCLALFSTLGFMAAVDIPLTNITTLLTSFLTVVGVADSVHILSIFYQRLAEHGDRRVAIGEALRHSGLAVVMTSVTTATGLMSFMVADVRPIADLGIVAPVGVMVALLLTVTLLPSLLAIFPVHQRAVAQGGRGRVDALLAWTSRVTCARSGTILIVALVIAAITGAGMTRLRFSQNGLKWFKKNATVRTDTETVDRRLGGSLTIEVVIDTGITNGVHDPDLLARLEESMIWAENIDRGEVSVSKASSLDTVIREINRALNANDAAFYRLPGDRELIAQELLLFEGTGSDDLEEIVDRDFRKVRATLTVPFRDAFQYVDLVEEIEEHFTGVFPEAKITMTGSNVLFVEMFHNIITTMAKSYAISLSVITLLMILLLGRLRIGLLSMVPNLLPLMIVLGIMGWLRIPLDISTVLIGSIAIGLVVDDTIHFMHNFRRYFEHHGTVREAVTRTLDTAGRAILITSIVLAGGFYSCMISDLRSSVIYGGLIGTTVLLALVADYFVTPALMAVVFRRATGEGPGSVAGRMEIDG